MTADNPNSAIPDADTPTFRNLSRNDLEKLEKKINRQNLAVLPDLRASHLFTVDLSNKTCDNVDRTFYH